MCSDAGPGEFMSEKGGESAEIWSVAALEEGVEKQEPVINRDMQLKNDSDVNVKFKC